MKLKLSILLLLISLCAYSQQQPFKISTTPLIDNVYVHTSYGLYRKTAVPANGLYVVTDAGIILIDTPWDEDQTEQLLTLLNTRYHKKVMFCISTHFHADRVGGVDVLKRHGIKTYSTVLTKQLAKEHNDKQPEFTFKNDTTFNLGNEKVSTYYPGAGHTKDNIVIWLPKNRVLFGGCFIKSLEAEGAGYIDDADMQQWPISINRVKNKFKDIKYVIPGHDSWKGDTLMLTHTQAIVQKK